MPYLYLPCVQKATRLPGSPACLCQLLPPQELMPRPPRQAVGWFLCQLRKGWLLRKELSLPAAGAAAVSLASAAKVVVAR